MVPLFFYPLKKHAHIFGKIKRKPYFCENHITHPQENGYKDKPKAPGT